MSFSSGNESGGPMAEINVTPLVDVMLVLLIIFMITTPLMNHKVKVKLPEAVLDNKPEKAKSPPVTISVSESGALFWNDEPATRQFIESKLSVEAQKTPQPPVQIRADRTTPYRLISEVVKLSQAQGVAKIGFITTPPKKGQ
ncbi:MAG: biopolymer transporter ExbD [Thermomonas sp.]